MFVKISQIGPWVSRICLGEEHPFYSTDMLIRLSDISSIYCQKCIFSVQIHKTILGFPSSLPLSLRARLESLQKVRSSEACDSCAVQCSSLGIREHSHMTSDVLGQNFLPTYLSSNQVV